ncbi:hypothetical protein [Lapidilactobacillus wuchangensis]|uniref:hypothetical protein n=1 Tax=Lapidilactobacillus wuchangensis TaxID=2486001 RepID=UPI000F767DB8|nr:hypothetical protein [Lapidilactobacillus wuchangensis]
MNANQIVPLAFGIVLLVVGIWELLTTVKYFKKLKTGKVKSKSGFIGFAAWDSLIFGIVFTVAGLTALISSLVNLFR